MVGVRTSVDTSESSSDGWQNQLDTSESSSNHILNQVLELPTQMHPVISVVSYPGPMLIRT